MSHSTARSAATTASSGELRVQVRSHAGDWVRTVDQSAADTIVSSHLGEWASFGRNRYVRLAEAVPSRSAGWQSASKTTRRAMNDAGVYIGAPVATQEHRP